MRNRVNAPPRRCGEATGHGLAVPERERGLPLFCCAGGWGVDKWAYKAQYVYMHRTIRIRPETYPKLKLICAILGVKLVVLLDEFADAKLAEAQKAAPDPTRKNKHSSSAGA